MQTNADFGSIALPLFSGNTELQRRVIHIHYFYFLLNSRLKARVVFLKSAAFSGRIFCEAEIFGPLSEVNGSVPPTSYGVDALCSAPHLPHRAGPRDVQIPVTSEQSFLYLPTCLEDPRQQGGSVDKCPSVATNWEYHLTPACGPVWGRGVPRRRYVQSREKSPKQWRPSTAYINELNSIFFKSQPSHTCSWNLSHPFPRPKDKNEHAHVRSLSRQLNLIMWAKPQHSTSTWNDSILLLGKRPSSWRDWKFSSVWCLLVQISSG